MRYVCGFWDWVNCKHEMFVDAVDYAQNSLEFSEILNRYYDADVISVHDNIFRNEEILKDIDNAIKIYNKNSGKEFPYRYRYATEGEAVFWRKRHQGDILCVLIKENIFEKKEDI